MSMLLMDLYLGTNIQSNLDIMCIEIPSLIPSLFVVETILGMRLYHWLYSLTNQKATFST